MFEKEKRKNTQRPRFQWWLLVAGFWIGVVFMLIVTARGQTSRAIAESPYEPAQIELTASALMAQAQATMQPGIDGLMATASQMVREATMTAMPALGTQAAIYASEFSTQSAASQATFAAQATQAAP